MNNQFGRIEEEEPVYSWQGEGDIVWETGMAWIDSRLGETKGHISQFACGTIRLKLLRFDGRRRLSMLSRRLKSSFAM